VTDAPRARSPGRGIVHSRRSTLSPALYECHTRRSTPIACRPGWALHVVRRIESGPPVSALARHVIWAPRVIGEVAMRRQGKEVVADLGEIALLPETAVYECHLIFRESRDIVRGQFGSDSFGMFARIAHYIRHRRLLPAGVDFLMTLFTGLRAGVVRRGHDG
jgi:hypothetical protein